MPKTALKHLAKRANTSLEKAEKLWDKAESIVKKEYGEMNYALVMGITKRMMGLREEVEEAPDDFSDILAHLLIARNVAHVWHWKSKSLSLHEALGDLYEDLSEQVDELAELYFGKYSVPEDIDLNKECIFSTSDPIIFINDLFLFLENNHDFIKDGFIVNKYEELQAMVSRTKYKMENLF